MRWTPTRVSPWTRCGHLTTAYSGPGGPEQGMDLKIPAGEPPLCKGRCRAAPSSPTPPLCKGRCRAAAEGLECLSDFPFTGYNSRFTTPQSASLTAPLAQGSLWRVRAKSGKILTARNCLKKFQKRLDKKGLFPYNKQVTPSGVTPCGGIAQLARAFGSYPKCHRFKSSYRYHITEFR